ncbi:sigma-54-dependent Fis family transcriptional regulator [Exilibacterium tricleocarpae]|uniref:Sigma-54-dependent Fis family transcriptional regulator n=1 Tax=Exilibacterium tricleocarpae TaxID=2591008 RepID=A0A545T1Y3_9GAMM|nr:sigma-54 dependent transcriptional regulator [Exilibacterium tricleocarpae]TQV71202.1 sigma-54-dependent Fis family transcriptional regulator [Exilibacterium tricleocarpae]
MTQSLALIIDDEPDIRELLEITLGRMQIDAHCAENLSKARKLLEHNDYHLCLTDLKLPDGNGIELVKEIQKHTPQLPVAVFTAHGNMDIAIEAMKAGAFDFLSKPVDLENLRKLVSSALTAGQSSREKSEISTLLIGNSGEIRKLQKKIDKLARSQAPIYISGESGSGKELVARSIHYQGPRGSGPFIPVNCGAIPTELMESEFFGHKKGSFTGAHQDKQGLFQAADGGTLFLDEVADLPLDMQVKLLRAIQEKAVRPIGAQEEIRVDVRILSATHKDLLAEITANRFRNDLFYRINVIELKVPSLRDRLEDLEPLSDFFLERLARELNAPAVHLSAAALETLRGYRFPGNVRELENILERAYTLCDGDEIDAKDLSLSPAMDGHATPSPSGASKARPIAGDESLDHYLEDIERELLLEALERAKWNKTNAAKALGISFRSLRYRLKKLGLEDD